MTILIDAHHACARDGSPGAGIEHYSWSMAYHLPRVSSEHRFVIAVPRALPEVRVHELTDGLTNVRVIRPILPRIPFISRHLFLPLRALLARADVLFSPGGQLPAFWKGRSAIAIHDVSIFDHPEWFPAAQASTYSTRVAVPSSIRRSSAIVAASEWTRDRLLARFPDAKGKVSVAYQGTEEGEASPSTVRRYVRKEDYVLFLGTIEPRKNLTNAVLAFDRFLDLHSERAAHTRFLLAGAVGWKADDALLEIDRVNEKWKRHARAGVVRQVGYVTEQEKQSLLAHCGAFLFPSLEEGFGRPVLEAMRAGAPVITTRAGAIPEIGGDAVLYVEPDDIENMSFLIAQCLLLPEGVHELREEARLRAKGFTWERCAEQTLEVIKNIRG